MNFLLRNSENGQEEQLHSPISATVPTVLFGNDATVEVETPILEKPLAKVYQYTHMC